VPRILLIDRLGEADPRREDRGAPCPGGPAAPSAAGPTSSDCLECGEPAVRSRGPEARSSASTKRAAPGRSPPSDLAPGFSPKRAVRSLAASRDRSWNRTLISLPRLAQGPKERALAPPPRLLDDPDPRRSRSRGARGVRAGRGFPPRTRRSRRSWRRAEPRPLRSRRGARSGGGGAGKEVLAGRVAWGLNHPRGPFWCASAAVALAGRSGGARRRGGRALSLAQDPVGARPARRPAEALGPLAVGRTRGPGPWESLLADTYPDVEAGRSCGAPRHPGA